MHFTEVTDYSPICLKHEGQKPNIIFLHSKYYFKFSKCYKLLLIEINKMDLIPLNILLADDDTDDCLFFEKALEELNLSTELTIVHDGEQLMNYLNENSEHLPDVLFLDLSMPRKNGFECLCELKGDEKFINIPVIMLSTAYPRDRNYEEDLMNRLMKLGARQFIRKPGDFEQLKQVIHDALTILTESK